MSTLHTTGKLLEHLGTLTRFRDTALLKVSLMNTMLSLTRVEHVKLYDVLESEGKILLALSAWSEGGVIRGSEDSAEEEQVLSAESDSLVAQAIERQMTLTVQKPDGAHSCCPILIGGHVVAAFEYDTPSDVSAQEQNVLEGVIGVFQNYLELLRESQHDSLTGLLNRKTFDQGYAKLMASRPDTLSAPVREQRHGAGKHWLAVMDIDHFKRINDRFGHLYGDEVLILMANLMRRSFRRSDRLYRFGGEEFVVLLRNANSAGVFGKLEQFRQWVSEHEFPQVGQVTISIGFSEILAVDNPTSVIGKADEALYYAKEHGRNRVCRYEELVATGELTSSQGNQDVEFF